MPDNNVRIKLSADTSQAQKDIKLIDQQIKELGKGAGSKGQQGSEDSGERASARDAGLGNLDTLINVDKQILKVLNNMYRMTNNPNSNRSVKYIAGRIDALGESIRGGSNGSNNSGNTNSDGGATTGTATPTQPTQNPNNSGSGGGNSGGNSGGNAIKSAAGKLVTATAILSAIKGVFSYIGEGSQNSASTESKAYLAYNSTRMFGSDFNEARGYAYGVGKPYGYGTETTIDFQDSYMARAGFTSQENLSNDTSSIMKVAKAYGIDLSNTGSVAGKYVQSGTFASGEQSKFANLLATSINEAGMTGRESEQLDVLESINDTLAQTLVTVSEDGQNNATALYNLLAATEDSLKGARGASAIESINDAITGGGNSMDVLLGWGTTYTGAAGRWELEKRKAEGISNPDNLSEIFSNYERFTGQSINSAQGKLALQELLGIDPELVEVLVQNAESIKTGNYSKSFISALESYKGDADVSGLIANYNNSKVSTQEQYANAKENAQAEAGNWWNEVTEGFKGWFSDLSAGEGAGATIFGKVVTGIGAAAGGKWLLGKLGSLFAGGGAAASGGGAAAAGGAGAAGAGGAGAAASGVSAGAVATTVAEVAAILGIAYVSSSAAGWSLTASGRAKQGSGNMDAGIVNLADNGYSVKEYTDALADLKKQLDDGKISTKEYNKAIGELEDKMFGDGYGTIADAGTHYFMSDVYGSDYTREDYIKEMTGREDARNTMMDMYSSADGKQLLEQSLKAQIEQEGKITEDFLANMLTITKNGYTYTGSQKDLDEILGNMYSSYNSDDISTWYSGRFSDSSVNKWLKNYYNSHALGLNYVPYDNYPANLHQGEAVLTADEAKKWRTGAGSASQQVNTNLSVSESASKVVDKFYEAIRMESESLEKREKYSSYTSAGYSSIANSLSSINGNNVQSNNVEEAKQTGKSSIWNRVLNFFGFNTSAAVGNDYIPYDNTPVNAHKGEAVLTADEAKKWRERNSIESINSSISVPQSSGSTYTGTNLLEIKLSGAVDGMTYENQHIIVQAVIQQLGLSKSSVLGNLGNSFVRTPN